MMLSSSSASRKKITIVSNVNKIHQILPAPFTVVSPRSTLLSKLVHMFGAGM